MKILIVNSFDAYAGSQRTIFNWLSIERPTAQFEIIIFCGNGFISDIKNVKIRKIFNFDNKFIRKLLLVLFSPFFWFYLLIYRKKFDLIIGNSISSFPLILPFFILNQSSIIIHEVTRVPFLFKVIIRKFSNNKNTLVVSDIVNTKLKINGSVIFNPLLLKGVNNNSPGIIGKKIVYVGDFRKEKRFEFFVEIANSFKSNKMYEFIAFLAQKPKKQEEVSITEIAITNEIQIRYGVKAPSVFYKDALFVVICTDESKWIETFSYVAAEALSYQIPIIATGISVLNELFHDSIYFNKNCNPSEICDLLLNFNIEKYLSCKLKSFETLNNFSIENYNIRIEKIFNGN